MTILQESTLVKIKQAEQTKNTYLRDLVDLYAHDTWDMVSANVKSGKAPLLYSVGTEMICNYTQTGTVYQFPWVVVDNDREVTWQDGTTHPGLILQAKYATIESIQFDAAEDYVVQTSETTALDGWYYWGLTGTDYTELNLTTGATIPHGSYDSIHRCPINNLSVLRYGYNRYSHCAYRQWLNSDEAAGDWWTAQHTGDKAPNELNTYAGFMAGLDSDFLAVINPVKVQVATNTVTDGGVTDTMYDKFWLPSVEEMYGSPQAAGVEGAYFPYWKTKTGLSAPSNSANSGRIQYALNAQTSAQNVRCRSAYRGNSYYSWYCNSSGELYTYVYSYTSYSSVPACAIS